METLPPPLPEPSEQMKALNEVWCERYGHPFTACSWLAQVKGDIGETHKKHILNFQEYMEELDKE